MDNLTHSLVGLVAAKAGLERTTPYAAAVCVIAANLPDADIVALVKGPTFYLANHRGITHSIVGTVALGFMLPVFVFALERLLARWRGRQPQARFRGLLICSLALIATHPILDWTNSYGVRPFLPWDGRWVYGDILFVIDPWLWLMLGGACFLLTARSSRRVAAWSLLAIMLTALLFFIGRRFGAGFQFGSCALWLAGLSGFFVLHKLRVAARFGSKVALTAAALVIAYCCLLSVVQTLAHSRAENFARDIAIKDGERVQRVAATPTFASLRTWRCLAETDSAMLRFDLTLGQMSPADWRGPLKFKKPEDEAARLVEGASADSRARVLLDFARFPVAIIGRNEDGAEVVRFADLRFTEPGARGSFALDVPVPAGH